MEARDPDATDPAIDAVRPEILPSSLNGLAARLGEPLLVLFPVGVAGSPERRLMSPREITSISLNKEVTLEAIIIRAAATSTSIVDVPLGSILGVVSSTGNCGR